MQVVQGGRSKVWVIYHGSTYNFRAALERRSATLNTLLFTAKRANFSDSKSIWDYVFQFGVCVCVCMYVKQGKGSHIF
jgi:hypothetical protein